MTDEKEEVESPDPYFEPLIHLPPVETKTLEEDEEQFVNLRAKLFRYDSLAEPPEWKERGTGEVKILKHKQQKTCRILMRRDKTLKICANHYVLPHMELKPNCGSEKAWVWSTPSDFADEEEKSELLAIRFANVENAMKYKNAFEKAQEVMKIKLEKGVTNEKEDAVTENHDSYEKDTESVAEKLVDLNIKDDSVLKEENKCDDTADKDSVLKEENKCDDTADKDSVLKEEKCDDTADKSK